MSVAEGTRVPGPESAGVPGSECAARAGIARTGQPATGPTLLEGDFVVTRRSFDVMAQISLAPGQRLSLFGTSGAGKTTILEAIAGTVTPRRGEVRLDGRLVNAAPGSWRSRRRGATPAGRREQPVAMRHRGIAVVRQPTSVFPHLSVRKNVAYGLGHARDVAAVLGVVGLDDVQEAMPEMLSGGQRQRVCLARALARPFRALLLDEPFSAIDVSSRSELRDVIIDAVRRQDAVALLVTHDLTEAQAFGHQIAVVDRGRLVQIADADLLVRQPATTRVASLCGYTSFLDCSADRKWALHPDRFIEGDHPDRGIVLSGTVASVQAFGSGFACDIIGAAVSSSADVVTGSPRTRIPVHVDSPPEVGIEWVVTAVDPPLVSRVTGAEEQEG
jgi:ABC-type sulfate/molybdate transport systems ATPase subunit